MNAVHLLCGAGGLSLGFERAGIETVLAFDLNAEMVAMHRVNCSGECRQMDVREAYAVDLQADVWTCGIPCEPFSVAGDGGGHSDPRDVSFEVVRLLSEASKLEWPTYVFLENVPPYRKSEGAARIRAVLRDGGFEHILEAVFLYADYGVCQMRRRWHIVASRGAVTPIPMPTHSEFPDLFGQQPWVRFGEIRDRGPDRGDWLSPRALRGIFRRIASSAAKYGDSYTPMVVDDGDLMPTVVSAWRARVNGTTPLIYDEARLRAPTLIEGRRAQGFPDDFQLTGNLTTQWKAVGQAVAPPFAEAVGRAMLASAGG